MNSCDSDVNQSSTEVATLMNEKKVLERTNRDLEEAIGRFTADLAAQAKKFVDLESKCKTLKINILNVTEDLTAETNKVADLECKIKTLEGNSTLMTSVLATQSNKIVDLESKNETLQGNVMKTNEDLITMTSKVVDLETKNKTLEDNITKAATDLATRDNTISDLESKVKTLEGNAKTMTLDLATKANRIVDLESKNKTLESNEMKTTAELVELTNKVVDLEFKNKTLEDKVTKAMTDCSAQAQNNSISILKSKIKTLIGRPELWMNENDDYEEQGDWVAIHALKSLTNVRSLNFLPTGTMLDGLTNVSWRYYRRGTLNGEDHPVYMIVELSSYPGIKEKALFSQESWFTIYWSGQTYVISPEKIYVTY